MKEIHSALFQFFSGLKIPNTLSSLPVYIAGNVIDYTKQPPTAPAFPYLVIAPSQPQFGSFTVMQVSIWTQSTSFVQVLDICGQIEKLVPEVGTVLKLANGKGAIVVERSNPFIQPLGDVDTAIPNIRAYNASIIVRSFVL